MKEKMLSLSFSQTPGVQQDFKKSLKLFFSTGDISGDLHGGLLIQELKKQNPNFSFFAVGGDKLKEAGAEILENSTSWSAIGIFDSFQKVPKIYLAFQRVKKKLKKIKPHGAILIDTPAVNIPLARYLHRLRIPVIYFFPPSAWKKDLQRAASVGRWVEKVVAPFPETAELYAKAGVPTYFSGHPLLDLIPQSCEEKEIFQRWNLDLQKPVLGLLPGSRQQEIRYILPLQLETARLLLERHQSLQFALPIASSILEENILKEIKKAGIPVVTKIGASQEVMQISKILLVASGTATLEAALYEKPMIICYKLSPLTWKVQRPFLKGVKFAGLPNLLSNEAIVPEFIQEEAVPEKMAKAIEKLFNPEEAEKMKESLRKIRPKLGEPGAIKRVAELILQTFHE
jgi:lipid-A-disaccharide synthase